MSTSHNTILEQTNVRLQDILNRLVRIESRLTRFGDEMGVDMRLAFRGGSRNPRKDPMVVEMPEVLPGELIDVVDGLLERAKAIETRLCRAMDLHGVSPQADRTRREMDALRHYHRTQR